MAIYSNSVMTNSPLLFISGQTPQKEAYIPDGIDEQIQIVVEKINSIIMDNEASTQNIVKMNVYLTDTSFLESLRTTLIKLYGENKPAMTVVIVAGLIDSRFKVEIDAIVAIK